MAKRGRKKKFKLKFNIRTETLRSVASILLILGGGVIVVSLFASGTAGNSKIQDFLRSLFGLPHIILAPILIIGGLLLLNNIKWKIVETRVLIGLNILLFATSGLAHSLYTGSEAYSMAQQGKGGGLVGYKIISLLEDTISIYGAILVMLAALILAIILILDKSIPEIVSIFRRGDEKEDAKGGLMGLLFRKRAKEDSSEGGDQDEIEITSSLNLSTEDTKILEDRVEPVEETTIEIVPSMSEPQAKTEMPEIGDDTTVNSLMPSLPYSNKVWELPPIEILQDAPNIPVDRGDVKQRAKIIEETLNAFGITSKVKDIRFGPSVTQYALETESGTKIAKISNLQYDLALALASPTGSVRIEAPIPGRSLVGIEVPNNSRVTVHFKDMLTAEQMKAAKSRLNIVLGLDVGGQPVVYNIGKMPHLLIAGATGSGKSIFIHSIMASILFRATPQECKFILIDPKRVELVHYNDIPHLLSPVVTDTSKAPSVFKWAVEEMERRYKLLETARVRNIEGYNEKSGFQALPYIVIIVDELAEIMVADPAAVEKSIIRLAQLARAVGIHLILALQRPSTNIITGLIKANIPCRVAFNVTSQVDSRVIIDQPGAEKLLGQGDMLFVPPDDSKPVRVQGALVTEKEIEGLVNYLKSVGQTDYKEGIFDMPDKERSVSAGGDGTDSLYDEAVEVVMTEGKGSASLLQRRLSIGYSRAARILDELEAKGIVGPPRGSKPREVLGQNQTLTENAPPQEPQLY